MICSNVCEAIINDEQKRICILCLNLFVGSVIPGHLQFKKPVRKPDIFGLITLLAGLHAEGTGHVGLFAACSTSNEEIAVFRDIFAVGQSSDKVTVQFAS